MLPIGWIRSFSLLVFGKCRLSSGLVVSSPSILAISWIDSLSFSYLVILAISWICSFSLSCLVMFGHPLDLFFLSLIFLTFHRVLILFHRLLAYTHSDTGIGSLAGHFGGAVVDFPFPGALHGFPIVHEKWQTLFRRLATPTTSKTMAASRLAATAPPPSRTGNGRKCLRRHRWMSLPIHLGLVRSHSLLLPPTRTQSDAKTVPKIDPAPAQIRERQCIRPCPPSTPAQPSHQPTRATARRNFGRPPGKSTKWDGLPTRSSQLRPRRQPRHLQWKIITPPPRPHLQRM